MNRKDFIKISGSLLWGYWGRVLGKTINIDNSNHNREEMIFGWTTCLTHETADRKLGFDFIIPYCEGRHKERETEEIERVIRYMAPMDCYLHTTIRRESPHNYQLPPKGPEYIKNIITWGKQYHKQNKQFIGMTFFNEVKIPQENRKAVYDSIGE